jgi:cytochrome c oxidase cbb3-type subunit III
MKRRSDLEISEIIRNGIPSAGMPAFHALADPEVQAVVRYLRVLQGPAQDIRAAGDPSRGKAIFFSKAECSRCHMLAGEGGFIASDLSEYMSVHSPEQVQDAIVHPTAFRMAQSVVVSLHHGQQYKGRIRNEDNFSLQLQSPDGAFHFLVRSDIQKIEPAPELAMPADYASRLNASEINDLVAYISQASGSAKSVESKKRQDPDDDDQ